MISISPPQKDKKLISTLATRHPAIMALALSSGIRGATKAAESPRERDLLGKLGVFLYGAEARRSARYIASLVIEHARQSLPHAGWVPQHHAAKLELQKSKANASRAIADYLNKVDKSSMSSDIYLVMAANQARHRAIYHLALAIVAKMPPF